ncbi:MAG: cupin domain-containing protein [Planctomycetota bacterium]|nr:MAG: cupin domain-containing protein [Planctomycetota bacterium]
MTADAGFEGVFQPETLIEYQADSIVSRTLVKLPTGSLTLFAVDAGQEISEHTAPYEAMIQVLDGEAAVAVGGTWYDVPAGKCIALPAGVPHALKAKTRFKMLLVMIKAQA